MFDWFFPKKIDRIAELRLLFEAIDQEDFQKAWELIHKLEKVSAINDPDLHRARCLIAFLDGRPLPKLLNSVSWSTKLFWYVLNAQGNKLREQIEQKKQQKRDQANLAFKKQTLTELYNLMRQTFSGLTSSGRPIVFSEISFASQDSKDWGFLITLTDSLSKDTTYRITHYFTTNNVSGFKVSVSDGSSWNDFTIDSLMEKFIKEIMHLVDFETLQFKLK